MVVDVLVMSWQSMAANRLRTSLAMTGIVVGVAAMIVLVGLGSAVSNGIAAQYDSLGSNALYVWPEDDAQVQDGGGTNARRARLTPTDVRALADRRRAPDVVTVAPSISAEVTATWNGQSYTTKGFAASPPASARITTLSYSAGRFYDDGEEARRAKVAVLGQTVIDRVFPGEAPTAVLRRVLKLNGVPFRVIGVQARRGMANGSDEDDIIYVPLSSGIDTVIGQVESYTVVALQAGSAAGLDAAQAQVERVLRETHRLGPDEPADFRILNPTALIAAKRAAADRFVVLLAAIAALSLLIGGIGVMNIMLVSVAERTPEIGLRKAVGADRTDVFGQFLAEAVGMSFAGGVVGAAVGVLVGTGRFGGMQPSVTAEPIVAAFAACAAVGILSGVYPAVRAAGLQPADALRRE